MTQIVERVNANPQFLNPEEVQSGRAKRFTQHQLRQCHKKYLARKRPPPEQLGDEPQEKKPKVRA